MPALDKIPSNVDPFDLLYCYAGYRSTLRHETVHVIHSKLAGNDNLSGQSEKSATWFSEGLAVYLSDSGNLSSPGGILSDTGSLDAYFAAGRPNPLTVQTRENMPGLDNSDVYPAFALAVKYLFDSPARGGAGNSLSILTGPTGMFQQIKDGATFATAFENTFKKDGNSLSLNMYKDNFQTWMAAYLTPLQTPATITGASGIKMAGIFRYWCDMIIGLGANVTSGNFSLNVSELTDGTYALCAMTADDTAFGPITVNVSGGKLMPVNYNVSGWPALVDKATIPFYFPASGGTGTISVMSSDVCDAWNVASNDPSWLAITAGSGSGNGTATFNVSANSGITGRTGTMTLSVDNIIFSVIQDEPCGSHTYRSGGTTHSYSAIQDAYNAMADGDTLQIPANDFTGGLQLYLNKTVKLQGGYNCDFTSNNGFSTISDKMTVKGGKVTIEKLIIK
jgi:hypothetical protein